ncbi:Hypothetical protein AAM4_2804 [Actinomyces succiniciruminis]|uniref:Uncharacterized protein n=1 Tax=Actinomyces succiniciruminis TaxID=1522002 RepID=A0A1L7RKM6_9ACTO|nr:Hypothetical protein AAM4_2804 [Actinomyces succiniciruminis]
MPPEPATRSRRTLRLVIGLLALAVAVRAFTIGNTLEAIASLVLGVLFVAAAFLGRSGSPKA